MSKIVTISNQKGGVGKTTTAINLAAYVAEKGHRVLIVDIDPQGNATTGLGIAKNQLRGSMYDVMLCQIPAEEVILHTQVDNLDILPCTNELVGAEINLINVNRREFVLQDSLTPLRDIYDFIFIDCPPSLGLLTLNALTASDRVIIPVQSEFFALEGLSQLVNTIKIVKERTNPSLEVDGVVLTMYDSRSIMSRQVTEEIQRFFGEKVYKYPVPRNIKVTEAPGFGIPISIHAPKSSGGAAYQKLAEEFINREEKKIK